VISIWDLTAVAIERWPGTTVGAVARHEIARIDPDSDVEHALMLLARREPEQMLLVTDGDGALAGIVTKTDILRAIDLRRRSRESRPTTETAV
jgi:CBS domain-containing protein